jgi:tetratricopeptide (TPR) repeat protein
MIGPSIALLVFFGAAADPAALSDQAQKFAERKQFAEAERLWKSSIAADAKYFPALFNLGYFYYSHGRYAEAVTFLERAADANPDDFNSRYLLGASQSKLNRTDAALRAWRVAQTLKPNQPKLLSLMVVEYGKGRYFNEAAEVAKLALKVNRDDETTFYLAIKALADAGDSAGAQDIAKSAVEKFPQSARANFEFGFHLSKSGKTEQSLQFLRRAMELDPKYEEPPFFLAESLFDLGRTEESLPFVKRAIENRPDYVPARVLLSRALMKLEHWDEAIAELRKTIQLDPSHPQPHLLMSQILFRTGDEARAKQERDLSLRLRRQKPESVEALQSRPFSEH